MAGEQKAVDRGREKRAEGTRGVPKVLLLSLHSTPSWTVKPPPAELQHPDSVPKSSRRDRQGRT